MLGSDWMMLHNLLFRIYDIRAKTNVRFFVISKKLHIIYTPNN